MLALHGADLGPGELTSHTFYLAGGGLPSVDTEHKSLIFLLAQGGRVRGQGEEF